MPDKRDALILSAVLYLFAKVPFFAWNGGLEPLPAYILLALVPGYVYVRTRNLCASMLTGLLERLLNVLAHSSEIAKAMM